MKKMLRKFLANVIPLGPLCTVCGIMLILKKQELSSKYLKKSATAHSSSLSFCSALNCLEKKLSAYDIHITMDSFQIGKGHMIIDSNLRLKF